MRVDARVDAFIPATYVSGEAMKIDLHRRLALAESDDELRELRLATEDRFGPVPEPVENLFAIQEAKLALARVGADYLVYRGGRRHRRPGGARLGRGPSPACRDRHGGLLDVEAGDHAAGRRPRRGARARRCYRSGASGRLILSRHDAFSMTRMRLSLVALASVGVLVAAGCGGSSGSSSTTATGSGGGADGTVATVAGTKITRGELDDLMQTAQLVLQAEQAGVPEGRHDGVPGTPAAGRGVPRHAGGVRAAGGRCSASTSPTPTSTKALDALIKQQFKGDRTKFDAYLKTTGYTLAQFRTGERTQLLGNRLVAA